MAPFSVRPPVHSTTVSSPWAASTEIACSTLARQDAVEKGRTMPVVPRIEIPPMMPSLALVVLRAIRSPSGTEMTTRTPLWARSIASPTDWVIIARGTGLHPRVVDISSHQPGAANTHRERCSACILSLNTAQLLHDMSDTGERTRLLGSELLSAQAQEANLIVRQGNRHRPPSVFPRVRTGRDLQLTASIS